MTSRSAAEVLTGPVKVAGAPSLGFADVAAAATYLSLSRAMIYKMLDAGDLPYAKFGTSRRIPWEAIINYGKSRTVKVERPTQANQATTPGDGQR